MVVGGGRIEFAHVEQEIVFDSMEGIKKYVTSNEQKGRQVFYLNRDNLPQRTFVSSEHVFVTLEGFIIKVWLPYNNLNMGC